MSFKIDKKRYDLIKSHRRCLGKVISGVLGILGALSEFTILGAFVHFKVLGALEKVEIVRALVEFKD